MNAVNMMKNRLLVRLSMMVGLLLYYAGMAVAADKVYINDFDIKEGQQLEVALNLDIESTGITRLQGTIKLPEGLQFVDKAYGNESAKANGDRIQSAFANLNTNTGAFAVASLANKGFTGATGPIAYFTVKAVGPQGTEGAIELSNFNARINGVNGNAVELGENAIITITDGDVGIPAEAELFVSFAENPVTMAPGETKDVEVNLTNSMTVGGLQARLLAEGISILEVKKGNRLSNWFFNNNKIVSTGDVEGNEGAIFTVTLKADENFIGEGKLTVGNVEVNINGKSIEVESQTLVVNVLPHVEFAYSENEVFLAPGEQKSVT